MNTNDGSEKLWSRKMMNVMRNIFLLWIFAVSNMMAISSYSQTVRFDLDMKNKTLQAVFEEIEHNSEFSIIYLSKDVNLKEIVSVQANQQTVDAILNEVLKKQQLLYEIKDKHIIVYKQNLLSDMEKTGRQQTGRRITGVVTDEKGEPIIGANVVEKGTTNGTVTDVDGKFSLTTTPPPR
jgi:hypothetical protein